MATKETPIGYKAYYKLMRERTSKKLEETIEVKNEIELELNKRFNDIKRRQNEYREKFNLNLVEYDEFVLNKYTTGKFYKTIKSIFVNSKNDYKIVSELFDLYQYVEVLKSIYDLENDIIKYNKLLKLTLKEYSNILKIYYTEVHKQLILEGKGYAFSNHIGWICINRCATSKRSKPKLDYAATKKREAELKAQGKRIYNKEEADWCLRNGIEYQAEDKRVFKKDEYYYEVPLISCKLKNAWKLKLELADYRNKKHRGVSNDELIEQCNHDTNKICELDVDLKTKLTLCNKADKILYTKFIRNEDQKSVAAPKANSKD